MSRISSLSIGRCNSALVTENHKVFLSGRNDHCCLGQDSNQVIISEMTELSFSLENIVAVALGDKFQTYLLSESDRVYAMGRNEAFQLGTGNNLACDSPVEVQSLRGKGIHKIFSSDYSVALSSYENLSMYVWGL